MILRNSALTVLGVLFLLGIGWSEPVLKITYPAPESDKDVRYSDILELVHTALEKTRPTWGDYAAGPCPVVMNEPRYLDELKTGTLLNVAWSSVSDQKEKDYIPIRIPLNKGIIGYRLCLTSRGALGKLADVKTVADLRKLTIGQGFGWGDIAIYQANGIPVFQASYTSLFRTLDSNLFDLFPRGLNEVFSEYQANRADFPNLVIDPDLLLYYPWPYYLFVSKSSPEVAARLEAGLKQMVKDGTFDRIFLKYHSEDIRKANLKGRRLIVLTNPGMPEDTPINDKALWFDPAVGK